MHRSVPGKVGVTDVSVVQSPAAETPAVELARFGAALVLPLVEAKNIGTAVEQKLRDAGLTPQRWEPGS